MCTVTDGFTHRLSHLATTHGITDHTPRAIRHEIRQRETRQPRSTDVPVVKVYSPSTPVARAHWQTDGRPVQQRTAKTHTQHDP
jgi:hypothetical protein